MEKIKVTYTKKNVIIEGYGTKIVGNSELHYNLALLALKYNDDKSRILSDEEIISLCEKNFGRNNE
jgi:hypothetical protein